MKQHFFSEIIPYAYFLDDGLIRLRGGGTMLGFHVSGPSHETSSSMDIIAACERFGQSLTHFGTGDFIHLISHRVPATEYQRLPHPNAAAALIDNERAEQFKAAKYFRTFSRLYISNEDESAIANQLKALFFASTEHHRRGSQELQLRRFRHRVEKWEDAIHSTLKPKRMNSAEMFRDLILCVNGTDYPAPLPRDGAPLHHVIGQQDFVGGNSPKIGQNHIRPISLVYPWPSASTEQALAVLLTHPGELTLSCRFICLDQPDAESILRLERKHYIREANGTGIKQWFVNAFNLQKRQSANQDTEEQITAIDHSLSALAKGIGYGWASILALVHGPDAEEVDSRTRTLVKDLADLGFGSRIEDAMAVEAIKGSWPGQGVSNERRPILSSMNFAELAMPVEHWIGTPAIDSSFLPKTRAPLVVTGTGVEPFFVPSHIRSVGHQIVIGPTVAGKSSLLGAMVAALAVLPNVQIVWLDRDYSSFVLTHAMGGHYIELAADESSPLCPFQWIDADNGVGWLFDWFSRLLARWQIDVDQRQAADLMKALELARASQIHTMTAFAHLVHDQQVRGALRNYMQGGQWAHVFDGEPMAGREGTLLTTYEMRHLDALGERAAGPATELIIRDAEARLGVNPTFVIVDEASWILSSPISRPFVDRALRTFRKYGAALIMATQSLKEVTDNEVRALLVESTAIKTFLPNREARGEHVSQLYAALGLKTKEIEIIGEAIPQRDYLCRTEYGSRLFRLDLGPIARALCTSTGVKEVAQARALLAEYGQEQFLEAWLHAGGLGPAPKVVPVHAVPAAPIVRTNGRIVHAA